MTNVAVVLAGCGHLDGAEIREAILTLTALNKRGASVQIFAPNIVQKDVVNHLTGKPMKEERNVLVEAARIARGAIKDLKEANTSDFDALILPGGFGAAKNLSNLAEKGAQCTVLPELGALIQAFLREEKPIGAICISPAVLVTAVKEKISPKVTLGKSDPDNLITALGGKHQSCGAKEIAVDETNHITSTPAYMTDSPLAEIAEGIEKLVEKVLAQAKARRHAA